jgi:hypothetical protein
MTYINIKWSNGDTETVDHAETRQEAKELLAEYHQLEDYKTAYLSNRATAEWRQDMTKGGHQ